MSGTGRCYRPLGVAVVRSSTGAGTFVLANSVRAAVRIPLFDDGVDEAFFAEKAKFSLRWR